MTVFRVNKDENYTTISNYHIKDKRISLKAKGLLTQMLSLPENWDYSIKGLIAINKENEIAIKSALNELKDYRYLIITKKLPDETESGRIEYVYDVYEKPKQEVQKQGVDFLGVEFLGVENQVQLNTNNKNTNNKINNNKKEIYKESFEEIWKMYPNKKGKTSAFKSFDKALKEGISIETIIDGIERYNQYIELEKIDIKYVKNGSTWFNQRCWEDDYTIKRKLTTKDIASKINVEEFLKQGVSRNE